MEIDIRTLIFIIGISHLMQVLIFSHQYYANKNLNGLGWWLLWSIFEVVGFLLILLRNIPSLLPVAIIFQNAVILSGAIFIYIGVVHFFGKKVNLKFILSLFACFLLLHFLFVFIQNDIQIRTLIFDIFIAIVSFLTAFSIYKNKVRSINSTANFNIAIFILHGSIFAYRSIMLISGTSVVDVFSTDFFNLIQYFDALIVGLLWTFGFIIMMNQKLNAEILETKKHFELIFNTSPDAVVITRASDGFFINCNESFTKISGYSKDDISGKSSLEINIYKNPDERGEVIRRIKERGFCDNYEILFQRKDGEVFSGLMSAKIIMLEGIPHIISVTRDISERKQTEHLLNEKNRKIEESNNEYAALNEEYIVINEELTMNNKELEQMGQKLLSAKEKAEENEMFLKAAMENSQAGIAIADVPSGKLKYVNKAGLLIQGKEHDEIVKGIDVNKYVSSWKILHFDGTPYNDDEVPLARAVLYGETISKELIVRSDNMEDRYVWANAAPIHNEKGVHIAAIVIFLDITDQKLVEQALKRSEEELRKAQQITHIGSWNLDVATNEVYWTEELYKMYGFNPNLPPPPYTEHMKLFTPESWELLSTSLAKTRETGIPYELELKTVRKDRSNGWMWVRGEAIKDNEGNTIRLWGAAQDISERKNMELELIEAKRRAEESDRLKSAFLANMSHEIRTPMNGILGFTELLKEPNLNFDEYQEYIDIIEKSGIRLINIINEIIDISKIESGQMKIAISESDINKQVEYIYNFFKPEVEEKGITLSFSNGLPTSEAIIKTDSEKVYAVLTNLVKNAIKFTSEGSIDFGYSKKGGFLEFFVNDTGTGFSSDKKEIIFERFRQVNESLTRNYEGAGLGLSISKAYIEMLGGKIWAKSEPGKGSAFYFTLPFNTIQKEKIMENSAAVSNGNQIKKLKILIAEDDNPSEMLLLFTVKIFSSDVIVARTGIETIEACRNNPDIDLILMDIQMPGMNGLEATRQIRRFNEKVIIIAQTAYGFAGDREKALAAGCNDYISKPIKKEKLMEMMEKYFNSSLTWNNNLIILP